MFASHNKLQTISVFITLLAFFSHLALSYPLKLTLVDAIKTAQPAASKWSINARLVYVVSTDAGESNKPNNGLNGTRSNWNVVFVDPKTSHNLLVAIRHGQPLYTRQLLMAFKSPINVGDLRYDSPAALQTARQAGKVRPGMTNFHFELRNEAHPVMRIFFRGKDSKYRLISLDEKTCCFLP